MPHIYEKNGAAIYAESFATIRAEADLSRFAAAEEIVVVRMIHAAGLVELAPYVQFTPTLLRLHAQPWKQGHLSYVMRAWSARGSHGPDCLQIIR